MAGALCLIPSPPQRINGAKSPRIDPMSDDFTEKKARASAWFRHLRDEIVAAFEALEQSHDTGPLADAAPGRFEVSETRRNSEDGSDAGGGLMSVMRDGRVFEKVGVNVSQVYGHLGQAAQN